MPHFMADPDKKCINVSKRVHSNPSQLPLRLLSSAVAQPSSHRTPARLSVGCHALKIPRSREEPPDKIPEHRAELSEG